MAHEQFERALRGPDPIFGTMVTFDSCGAVETLAELGPDFIILDCQHSFIDERAAQRLLYAAHNPRIATLVRVSSHAPDKIGLALDAGADGVIVPMVNNAAEARAAVAACRYAPAGVRSYGPTRRRIGNDPAVLEQRASCFVMVETVEALRNVAEICAVPGLAGIYVGPADLGISMGLPIRTYPAPAGAVEAVRLIARECRKAGIIAGIHGGYNRTLELIEDGFQLIGIGLDWTYIVQGVRADLAMIQEYREKNGKDRLVKKPT